MTKTNNSQHKKRTCRIVDFAVPADHRVKKCVDAVRKLKTVEHEIYSDIYCNWCSWYSHQTGGLGNNRTSKNHPIYSNVKIGKKIENSAEDLWRLVGVFFFFLLVWDVIYRQVSSGL